jgi:hypothetical protein
LGSYSPFFSVIQLAIPGLFTTTHNSRIGACPGYSLTTRCDADCGFLTVSTWLSEAKRGEVEGDKVEGSARQRGSTRHEIGQAKSAHEVGCEVANTRCKVGV